MSWNTIDPRHRQELEQRLTKKQLDVLVLMLAGCGSRRISDMLGISRTAAKDHMRTARNALANLDRKDAA